MAKRAGCPVIPFAVVREEAELRPRLFAMMGESKAGPFKGYEKLDPSFWVAQATSWVFGFCGHAHWNARCTASDGFERPR